MTQLSDFRSLSSIFSSASTTAVIELIIPSTMLQLNIIYTVLFLKKHTKFKVVWDILLIIEICFTTK